MNHRGIFRDNDLAFFIKLQGHLFVNYQYIVHFGFKIRIPFFTVVFDLEWFDIRSPEDFLEHGLRDCGKPGITRCLHTFLDMLVDVFLSPQFL